MESTTGLHNLKLSINKIIKELELKKTKSSQDILDNHTLRFTELILNLLKKDSKSFADFEDTIFIFSYLLSLNKGHKYGVSFYANKSENFSKRLYYAQKRAKSICDYFQNNIKGNTKLDDFKFIFEELFVFQLKGATFNADINVKNISNLFKPLGASFHVKIEQPIVRGSSEQIFYEKIVRSLEDLDIDEYITYINIK